MTTSVDQEAGKKAPRRSASGRLGLLLLSVAFLGLAGGFSWGFYYVVNLHEGLSQQVNHLATAVTEAQTENQTLQDAMTAQQATVNTLSQAQQGNKSVWRIAEAQYLAQLANDTLQVGDNMALVISLLQAANQRLSEVTDVAVDALRKALDSDLATLQQVKPVDKSGLYLSLSTLNNQIDSLPVQNRQAVAAPVSEENSDLPWWKRGLHQSLKAVKQLVVVRYNAEGVRPFISPEQVGFLYQNLHAMLEQAMTALVLKQPDIYRESLHQATAWLKQYYVQDSAAVIAAINQLETLQAVQIRPDLPALTVLPAFQTYLSTPVATDTAVKS